MWQVMEYVGGGDLYKLVERCIGAKAYLDEPTIWRYLYELSHAVAFLHNNGIIHRDIKCQNIMLTDTGHIKLIDLVSQAGRQSSASQQSAVSLLALHRWRYDGGYLPLAGGIIGARSAWLLRAYSTVGPAVCLVSSGCGGGAGSGVRAGPGRDAGGPLRHSYLHGRGDDQEAAVRTQRRRVEPRLRALHPRTAPGEKPADRQTDRHRAAGPGLRPVLTRRLNAPC